MLKHPLVQAGLSATELVAAQLEVKKELVKESERGAVLLRWCSVELQTL